MPQDSIVCTIASTQFPFYLQMDGNGVTHTESGSGNLGVGHGAGPLDQFRISPRPQDGSPHITPLESVAYPGVYVRMDARGVNQQNPVGGIVNKQLDKAGYEWFIIRWQSNNTVEIESQAFPGVYLRLSTEGAPKETGVVINCQFDTGPATKFRLEPPPAKMQLRVLSYNTHLMQFSFLEEATDFQRKWEPAPYAVWQDEARRDVIIRNAVNSLADIVSFQEVWAIRFEDDFKFSLKQWYPYSLTGDPKEGPFKEKATSGLVLCSKFELTDRFFERFPGMSGYDDYSNKGVLCGVANIPSVGRLRIGTGHTTGALRDTQWIADKTVTDFAEAKNLPAIMMGDFNIGWKSGEGNEDYQAMKKVFSFPDKNIMPATDSWIHVHGEGINPNPYTVKMCDNTLHQLFSPERNTEPDTRLDYLWVKPGVAQSWSPVKAIVPRGLDWTYKSPHWHWAHDNLAVKLPSAAALNDDLLVVVSKASGGDVTDNGRVMCAILDGKTSKWRHYFAEIFASASPGIVVFEGKFHLFYRYHEGNAIFHRSSDNGEKWTQGEYTGLDTGGSVCPIKYNENLYLLRVDDDGIGGMIYCHYKQGEGFGSGNWSPGTPIDITTYEDISATVLNDWLVVVSKDNDDSSGYSSSGVMCSIFKPETGRWERSHPVGLNTKSSPGVIAVENRLHVYYMDPTFQGNAVYRAIYDGANWEIDQNTGQESMRGGVCPVLFKDQLWLFFPYFNVSPGHGYYSEFSMLHTKMPPDQQVDLSDHYPLLVDFDIVFIQVVVKMRDKGEGVFADGEWAGTRAEDRPLEGFQLTSQVPNLKLSYMAHIQDQGDTTWEPDGKYIGTSGKRIEGFAIKLEGDAASSYELTYRAHLQKQGDTDFSTEGEFCGSHEGRAVEAMWIRLQRK